MLKEKTTLLKKIKKQLTYNVRCAILYKLLLRKKRQFISKTTLDSNNKFLENEKSC